MKRIAIIGTGISGLGVASLLHPHHDITIYESEHRLGGHARTIDINYDGTPLAVDTGFIVFNYRNYPLLTSLFKALDVPVQKSDMSLGLSLEAGRFEWGCQTLGAVFAQRRNLISPRFWRMIRDILRFNRQALEAVGEAKEMTLRQLLATLRLGEDFRHRFLLPTAGAIWSSTPDQMLDFPAHSFVHFFHNHGLLSINDQPQWYTVAGGSREYIRRLSAPFADRIRLSSPVTSVQAEDGGGAQVFTQSGAPEHYDAVIFACHSDQALRLIANPSGDEQAVLGAIPYQNNRAYLHRDASLMPRNRACWSSWNYLSDSAVDERARITVTYWMNRLQSLPDDKPLFVTLNPPAPPREELVFDEYVFEHPVYSVEMLRAQEDMPRIQGVRGLWFCGAYQRHGFHEDGLASAVAVAEALGCEVPWRA